MYQQCLGRLCYALRMAAAALAPIETGRSALVTGIGRHSLSLWLQHLGGEKTTTGLATLAAPSWLQTHSHPHSRIAGTPSSHVLPCMPRFAHGLAPHFNAHGPYHSLLLRTGDDGALDAHRAAVLHELEVAVHVVEELRDDQVGARVDLRGGAGGSRRHCVTMRGRRCGAPLWQLQALVPHAALLRRSCIPETKLPAHDRRTHPAPSWPAGPPVQLHPSAAQARAAACAGRGAPSPSGSARPSSSSPSWPPRRPRSRPGAPRGSPPRRCQSAPRSAPCRAAPCQGTF